MTIESEAPKSEETTAPVEGQKEQTVDVNELARTVESLKQSNSRLLDESKSWKSKYQSIRNDVEQQESDSMKEKNDFKGLYEKTLEEKNSLMQTMRDEKKSSLETTLKYEVAKNAKDAVDTDLLVAAIKMKKRDVIGYDTETNSWTGVDSALGDLRSEIPSMFSQDKPTMVSGRPGALPVEKTLDQRIDEDADAVLKDALGELLSKQHGGF